MSFAAGGLAPTTNLMKSQSVDKFTFKDRERRSQAFTPIVSRLSLLDSVNANDLEKLSTPNRRGRNLRN